jgi:Resolvase, N terminal domain
VREYLNGGDRKIKGEFTEVESGKRADRPQLAAALAACRLHGAQLIIAKLDRLARNVAFVSNLMEAGIDFVAVDFPQANRLTVHILAAVAEHEAKMISERTKTALAAAKARGVKLGGDRGARLTQKARRAGWEARMARADAKLQAAGVTSLRDIAAEFECPWHPDRYRCRRVADSASASRAVADVGRLRRGGSAGGGCDCPTVSTTPAQGSVRPHRAPPRRHVGRDKFDSGLFQPEQKVSVAAQAVELRPDIRSTARSRSGCNRTLRRCGDDCGADEHDASEAKLAGRFCVSPGVSPGRFSVWLVKAVA